MRVTSVWIFGHILGNIASPSCTTVTFDKEITADTLAHETRDTLSSVTWS